MKEWWWYLKFVKSTKCNIAIIEFDIIYLSSFRSTLLCSGLSILSGLKLNTATSMENFRNMWIMWMAFYEYFCLVKLWMTSAAKYFKMFTFWLMEINFINSHSLSIYSMSFRESVLSRGVLWCSDVCIILTWGHLNRTPSPGLAWWAWITPINYYNNTVLHWHWRQING